MQLRNCFLYVTVIHVIYSVMLQCGDDNAALIVIKSLYITLFMLLYICKMLFVT